MALACDVAVWRKSEGNEVYAFPLHTADNWKSPVYPLIDPKKWTFLGVLPTGTPSASPTTIDAEKQLSRVEIAGLTCITATWAVRP